MKKLILLGDSTCAIKTEEARPETGWGEAFAPFMDKEWTLINLAQNGRSTEMILLEGIFADACHIAEEGDYVIIQFGHNETKKEIHRHTEPWTTYQYNLQYMINRLSKKRVKVILISSIARRNFIDGHMVDTHGDYPLSMKAVAERNNIPFIEMSQRTLAFFEDAGENESLRYFMNFPKGVYPNYPEGKEDNTHLRPEGAALIASMIAEELKKTDSFPFLA